MRRFTRSRKGGTGTLQTRETRFGHMIVLDPGDELMRSLIAFAHQQEVKAASLTGLGAVRGTELGFYSLPDQDYLRNVFDEELEACALVGNLSLLDDEPLPHVHGVFARRDGSTVGGHIFETVCAVTLELAVHTDPHAIVRGPVEHCSLQLMKLEERA